MNRLLARRVALAPGLGFSCETIRLPLYCVVIAADGRRVALFEVAWLHRNDCPGCYEQGLRDSLVERWLELARLDDPDDAPTLRVSVVGRLVEFSRWAGGVRCVEGPRIREYAGRPAERAAFGIALALAWHMAHWPPRLCDDCARSYGFRGVP